MYFSSRYTTRTLQTLHNDSLTTVTLKNIPDIFVKYTDQLIYAPERPQYATKHMMVLMSGTIVDPSMDVMVPGMSATLV